MKRENLAPFAMPLLCVILGVLAVVTADSALKLLCYVAGALLIAAGVAAIVAYLRRSPAENAANNGFVLGCILLLLGVLVIIKAGEVSLLIPFALGFLIAVNGIRELQNAIDAYRLDVRNEWLVVLLAIVNVVLGVILMVNPGFSAAVLMRVIGAVLIVSGVADFITTAVISHKNRSA